MQISDETPLDPGDRPMSEGARSLLARAAELIHPGPVPLELADLVAPRFRAELKGHDDEN